MSKMDHNDRKQAIPKDWPMEVIGCPQCKKQLTLQSDFLHCSRCNLSYAVEDGIPTLLSPSLVAALQDGGESVKHYYFKEEHYDWTHDPRGLELAYHRYRKWQTWKQVLDQLKPGGIALDVGCGTGLITSEFRRRFHKVIALDLNRWALCQMDGKPYVVKVQGDGETLPIQSESIDLVVVTEMIEHLEAPAKAAREIFRVCKSGAKVIGSVPSTSNVWNWRRYLSMTCGGGEPFHRNYTKEEIEAIWREAGFTVSAKSACLGLNWLCILEKA